MAQRAMTTPSFHTPEGRIAAWLLQLPPAARRKYEALRAQVTDGAALTRAAMDREKLAEDVVNDVSRRLRYVDASIEPERVRALGSELEDARAAFAAANAERTRRAGVRANAEQVLVQLNYNFLAADSIGGPYGVRAYSGPPAAPRNGESLSDAVLRIRREVVTAQSELAAVRRAPPAADEARAAIVAEINRLAGIGTPQLSIANGKATLWFPDQQQHAAPGSALAAPSGSASALLCWLFRDQIVELCTARLEQVAGGITAADRAARIAELERQLFQLEHDEEQLIEAAVAAGLEVHRRPHASPYALLGIEPRMEQEAPVAAVAAE
jgi:hypothetical protein